jgi:uncharacterized protein YkwD
MAALLAVLLHGGRGSAQAEATVEDGDAYVFAGTTASPSSRDVTPSSARDAMLRARCGGADAALDDVARRLVARKRRGLPPIDVEHLTWALRAAGAPHVWPRAWVVAGRALDADAVRARLDAWVGAPAAIGARRCGLAAARSPDGSEVIAVVAVDALADLAPLPVRSHAGAWMSIDARMLVPSAHVRVVVLGPSGEPHAVLSTLEADHVRARFAPDRPGAFVVQIVADVAGGPRPVLEALVFADVPPPASPPDDPAPGEEAGAPTGGDDDALARMITAARHEARRRPLLRDARLDAIARAHAARMMARRALGHDVGDGDPAARLEGRGLEARETGENVAHAASVALAHRALYASPSHRENLLGDRFERMGVGVVRDGDGSVWVTETFARDLR